MNMAFSALVGWLRLSKGLVSVVRFCSARTQTLRHTSALIQGQTRYACRLACHVNEWWSASSKGTSKRGGGGGGLWLLWSADHDAASGMLGPCRACLHTATCAGACTSGGCRCGMLQIDHSTSSSTGVVNQPLTWYVTAVGCS
jgi:hypothetical protein